MKLWTKTRALPSQLMLNMPTASAAGEVTAQHVVAREEAIDRWFGGGGSSNPAIEAEVDTIRRQLLAEEEERVRRRARQTGCEAWVRVRRGELSGGERSAAASAARLRGARLQVEADIARAVAQMLPHAAARQLVQNPHRAAWWLPRVRTTQPRPILLCNALCTAVKCAT